MTFEDLYRSQVTGVHRFALFLSGTVADADDLTAEAFVRAWAADAPLRAVSIRSYLFAIVRNLHRRQAMRERREVFGEVDTVDPEPDPERTTAAKFELRSTLARLQSLAEVDRAAVIMRAFNGCSYLEIAAALQISEAAAKVKVHRARRYLAEHKRIK